MQFRLNDCIILTLIRLLCQAAVTSISREKNREWKNCKWTESEISGSNLRVTCPSSGEKKSSRLRCSGERWLLVATVRLDQTIVEPDWSSWSLTGVPHPSPLTYENRFTSRYMEWFGRFTDNIPQKHCSNVEVPCTRTCVCVCMPRAILSGASLAALELL